MDKSDMEVWSPDDEGEFEFEIELEVIWSGMVSQVRNLAPESYASSHPLSTRP